MNRNVLKWILIGAVILGAATYLILSEMPSGQRQGKQRKEKIVVGHSKAFEIEPIEGITISAPENALDKDRKFKLTAVDDKTYDKVTKAYENTYIKPLFVFEFDAGLKPDEHLPGDVDVVWDLDEMGIPRELQDQFVVYRAAGTGKSLEYLRYKTQLDNGKLSFKTNQNSFLLGAILVAAKITAVVQIGRRIFEYSPSFGQKSSIRNFFSSNATSLAVPIQDPSGDFVIHFRFSDTERSNGYQAFMDNEKAVFDRLEELEKQATAKYEAKVDKEVRDQQKGYSFWQKLFSKKQVEAIKESISKEKILDELVKIDSVLTRLNTEPAGNLPPSILKIKEQIIRANEYLNGIGLHPFNYEIPVYLVNDDVVGSDVCGAAQKYYFCGNAYLLLNYKHEKTDQLWEKFQCTIVHELFHARQQSYYALTTMNSAPAESTAAALEDDAAILWFKNKVFKTDATTVKGANDICTDRDHNYVFAYPLEKAMSLVPSGDAVDAAYSLSYAIEGIRKNADKEYMSMYFFALNYSLFGPHTSGWKGWIKTSLNIDDQQFDDGWFYFGETNLNRIYKSQIAQTTPNDAATTIIELSKDHPISKLEKLEKPKDYSVNTFRIDLKSERIPGVFGLKTVPANVFVSPSNRKGQLKWNSFLRFYLYPNEFMGTVDESDHLVPLKPNLYCTTEGSFPLAAIATTQSQGENNDYFIVALYAPDAPDITKVKDDHISFVVSKPERVLTKNKFITGAVVTYTDKNGNTQTLDVNPKQFGKRVKWPVANASKKGNAFTLTAHWYYKPDDQTTYVSPESKMAEWGGHLDEQEEPQAEEKAPETNYWKLVNVRMEKTNTSYKESQNPDEEVDADYRSIDFAVDRTEKSCMFMGIAATEEVHDDNTRHYVRDLYLDGTLTYTEPPKFWTPGQQYKANWEIADDPYLKEILEPFVFEAENSRSEQAVCLQSKNDKIDKGWSSLGETNWLRGTSTTFEAHSPEKDGPKSFTLIQSYSIAERPGSSLMAKVVFYYDYEWVGEPEEDVNEKEPEGGHWKLVKVYEDNTHAAYEYDSRKDNTDNVSTKNNWKYNKWYITGGGSRFMIEAQQESYIKIANPPLSKGTMRQSTGITPPKKYYFPGESIQFDYQFGDKSIDGDFPDYVLGDGFRVNRGYITRPYEIGKKLNGYTASVGASQNGSQPDMQNMVAPPYADWARHFIILDKASAGAASYEIGHYTVYEYEWVDDNKKPEPTEKPVSGGHWRLMHTFVSSEQGMMSGGDEGIVVQGGKGHYTVHAEIDGIISDREIIFEKPKSVYMPGEQITLKVTNEKPNVKGGKKGLSYGDIAFSTGQFDGCVQYDGWEDHPSENTKKVVGVAKGMALNEAKTPGVVNFTITEYIKINGRMSKVNTIYAYVWEE